MSRFKFVIQGGKKLIKLYRGETNFRSLQQYYRKKYQAWFIQIKIKLNTFLMLATKVKKVKEFSNSVTKRL
jgi:hypothetical protein